MCGIIGVIGKSKDPIRSYNLITNLFKFSQIRGLHASGFYGIDESKQVWTYKDSLPTSKLIKTEPWLSLKEINCNPLIAHARYAAVGDPRDDSNNHPIISKSGNIALIYNGKFETLSNETRREYTKYGNDAVFIHRVILKENNILSGIHKVYNLFGKHGTFACALAYRDEDKSYLYFFRDEIRPLVLIDLTKDLGQYIVLSEESIWNSAIYDLKESFDREIIEVNPFQIFKISEDLDLHVEDIKQETIKEILDSRKEKEKNKVFFRHDENTKVFSWKNMSKFKPESRQFNVSEEEYNQINPGQFVIRDNIIFTEKFLSYGERKMRAFGLMFDHKEEAEFYLKECRKMNREEEKINV